ncbi:hypothetical protein BpHYR1_032753 [Brachionus plicatilis]|uniref:Uncharacterized protein n=1 Tax=Brachionus plicatilis TaxID=10195 RepID=A0A3M7QTE0_BRAPC|nr:hypothetical protein BpHYR1_032753 [Brachionus plicatilis]
MVNNEVCIIINKLKNKFMEKCLKEKKSSINNILSTNPNLSMRNIFNFVKRVVDWIEQYTLS